MGRRSLYVWIGVALLLALLPAAYVQAEAIAGRGTQITTDASYWERNPRVVKFGTTYYLFYTKSLVSGSTNPDGYEYDIYYRTSSDGSTWSGATKLTSNSIGSGFHGRDVAVTQDGSNIWVMWIAGGAGTQVYYYTYNGSTWSSQQTASGVTGVTHGTAFYHDSKVWLFTESGGSIKYWTTTDGSTWTGPTTALSAGWMPHAIYAGGKFHVVYTDWGSSKGIKLITSSDATTWSTPLLIHDTAYDDYDPAIVEDADGDLHVVWAPYDTSSDSQWLVMSSSQDGYVWSTPTRLTEPISGVWDFWPEPYNSGSGDPWLFYASNYNSGVAGICHVWKTTIPTPDVVPVWTKYSGNPIVTGSMALDPCVIKDGSTYKMWYTHVGTAWSIYYATSADGMSWSGNTQVLTVGGSGDFDETRVVGPCVLKEGATDYKMWYAGRDAAGIYTIGYATSTDGASWSKQSKVLDVVGGTWESAMVREPWVINDGGTYKMWYEGTHAWPLFKIGYATSPNGSSWTKHGSNPIYSGTSGGWDGFQVYAPSVVKDGSTYHMFYSGTDEDMSQRWSTGHATSSDGISWTGVTRNPILIPDTGDSADYVSAMNDGGAWKLWYSYGGTYAIGLATLDGSTQLWLDPAVGAIPNDNSTTKTYTVNIANAADLYGYQFVITFDKNNLECTAAAFDGSFFTTDVGKSSSPAGWNATIDNANGRVYFARTLLYPESPLTGSGALATVTFRSTSGASNGVYKVDFTQSKLADIESNVLSHTTQYAWLTLTTTAVGTISGSVDLQGRSDESGGTVTVMNAIGYLRSEPIVAADGSWSITGIPVGNYQVNIEMARYLDGQKGDAYAGPYVTVTSGGTTTLNKVKLLGGDANDDDLVDISDGTIIGGMFGQSPPSDTRADINNDGTVDIQDLVLFGGNYTWTSPVPWS